MAKTMSEKIDKQLDKILRAGNGIAGAAMPANPDVEFIDEKVKNIAEAKAKLVGAISTENLTAISAIVDELVEKAKQTDITMMGRVGNTGRLNIKLEELIRPLFSDYVPDED